MTTIEEANSFLQKECGVIGFFANESELLQIAEELNSTYEYEACESNAEYGDFQTNRHLTNLITTKIHSEGISPKVVIEPTCGKGHFILAVLGSFDAVETIYGIEIQKKYIWQTKR